MLVGSATDSSFNVVPLQILPAAAFGCASFAEMLQAAEGACIVDGGLLAAAVSKGSLSMTSLLLDLQECTG